MSESGNLNGPTLKEGPYSYTVKGGEVTIVGFDKEYSGELFIACTLGGCPVTCLDDSAFSRCLRMTGVVIPDSVINIGEFAFTGCSRLVSVCLGRGVADIGAYAFGNCMNLESIRVATDNPVFTVCDDVLFGKTGGLLLRCPERKAGNYAVPEGVIEIADSAFSGCSGLTAIEWPVGLKHIGIDSYFGCSKLIRLSIPAEVTSIGPSAFAHCDNLTSIDVDHANHVYRSVDGVLYDKALTTLVQYPCRRDGSLAIPESVQNIEYSALDDCPALTAISVCNRSERYEVADGLLIDKTEGELVACPGGRKGEFTIPPGVRSIAQKALNGCGGITAINVDARNPAYRGVDGVLFSKDMRTLVRYPPGKAGCYVIPEGVECIENEAFHGCGELTEIHLPGSFKEFGLWVFNGCFNLMSINVDEDNAAYSSVNGVLFSKDLTVLERFPQGREGDYTVPGHVREIADEGFFGYAKLTCVMMPKSVSRIGGPAFFGFNGSVRFV